MNARPRQIVGANVYEIGAPAQRSPTVDPPATIKSRIAKLWPQIVVAVGVGLSLVWAAGLFWLLYELV